MADVKKLEQEVPVSTRRHHATNHTVPRTAHGPAANVWFHIFIDALLPLYSSGAICPHDLWKKILKTFTKLNFPDYNANCDMIEKSRS